MGNVLLVEDNPNAVKKIIQYISKISSESAVVSFAEAGVALQYAKDNEVSLFILFIFNVVCKGSISISVAYVQA